MLRDLTLLLLFCGNINAELDPRYNVAVYWAPFPFLGSEGQRQLNALMSLIAMQPRPHIYVIGNHHSFYRVAEEFPDLITVCSDIDFTARGTPLFNSVFHKSRSGTQNFTAFLFSEFGVRGNFDELIGKLNAGQDGKELIAFSYMKRANKNCWKRAKNRDSCGKIGFWMWKNDNELLKDTSIPPFSLFHGKHDAWLARETSTSNRYSLVDVSDLVLLNRPETELNSSDSRQIFEKLSKVDHSKFSGYPSLKNGTLIPKRWRSLRRNSLEATTNELLMNSAHNKCFTPHKTCNLTLYKMNRCSSGGNGAVCLSEVQCSPFEISQSLDQWGCNFLYVNQSGAATSSPLKHISLKGALRANSNANKTVIMTGGTFGYKEMIMNFVCNLRRLNIQNPIVVSFEEEMYHFGMEMGLAMVYEDLSDTSASSDPDCVFGTDCFKRVTKLKSYFVLKALKLGYNVLWSDADVAWFKDPLPELYSYGPNVLPIQSDVPGYEGEPIETESLNSGFYFARAEAPVMAAFESIVEIARTTETSEQPTFSHVLCHPNFPGNTRIGRFECYNSNNKLTTKTLPRKQFPNGIYLGFFERNDLCHSHGCYMIHNNYLKGELKIPRFKNFSLWYYDSFLRACVYGEVMGMNSNPGRGLFQADGKP